MTSSIRPDPPPPLLVDEVMAKIKTDLNWRGPNLGKPAAYVVLPRAWAAVLLEAYEKNILPEQNHRPSRIVTGALK